ncbi:MAG: bifunctional 4-hydroxy-2-oxoglutarate aldolase/2-dehydro-3-deoxy-phosphogluconate aldolase [Candidatus Methylomirabilota bacterium]
MGASELAAEIRAGGIVAVLRSSTAAELLSAAEAVRDGGLTAIALPLGSPELLRGLERARVRLGRTVRLGVRGVLTADDARRAVRAGAEFLSAPTLNPEVLAEGAGAGVAVFPGGLTPTEIARAWELGAAMVAVSPAGPLGPQYIRALCAALPHVPLMPTGDISLEQVGAYLLAGAAALELDLVSIELLERRALPEITARAAEFAEAVRRSRRISAQDAQPIRPVFGSEQ